MSNVDNQQSERTAHEASRTTQWLIVTAITIIAITLASVHAPARIKLLGLFSIGYGLLAGWLLGRFAQLLVFHKKTIVGILSFGMIAAGFVGMAVESHRIFSEEIRAEYGSDPTVAFMQKVPPPKDKEAKQRYDEGIQQLRQEREQKLDERTSFSKYLKKRVSSLGKWQQPWPELFWAIEILLGCTAGAWLAHRMAAISPGEKNQTDQ